MNKKQGLVEEISEKLFDEFQLVLPLHSEKNKRGKKLTEGQFKANSETALKQFYQTADQERQRHHLGVIGRARVAFSLQQRLLKAGYPAMLVKQVLLAMLASVFVSSRHES